MEKADRVDELFKRHGANFSGSFHNLLWQVVVNGARSQDQDESALVLLHDGAVGIADRGVPGYTPCMVWASPRLSMQQQYKAVDALNEDLFHVSSTAAHKIIASTMKQRRSIQ